MKRKEPENVVQEQDEGSSDDNADDNGDGGDGRECYYASPDRDDVDNGDEGDYSRDGRDDKGDGGESNPSSGNDDENDAIITVGIDSALLDCPICFEPLDLPLFQCRNGHIICSQCCNKVHGKCPTCTLSISHSRCLPLESIIESNRISCPYSRFGCVLPIIYAQRHAHKESCLYAPCFCPIPACKFRGTKNDITFHLGSKHPSFELQKIILYGLSVEVSLRREQPLFILRGVHHLSFLLLNSHIIHSGNELSVVCIRPGPASFDFQYELEVAGDMGKKLRLDASPENVRKWTKHHRSKFFLYVPDDLVGSSGVINVKVRIQKLSWCPEG